MRGRRTTEQRTRTPAGEKGGWAGGGRDPHPAITFHNEGMLKFPPSRLMESLQQVTCAGQCVKMPHFISDFYWPDTERGVSPVLTGRSRKGEVGGGGGGGSNEC